MKKIMATVMMAIFILFTGCSTSSSTTGGQPISNGAGSSELQNSLQASTAPSDGSSDFSSSIKSDKVNVGDEGTQIKIFKEDPQDSLDAECLDPHVIGFTVQNISKKPITNIIIRAASMDGCAASTEGNNSLVYNSTYPGSEWDYTGSIQPSAIKIFAITVIPKQLKNQKLVFDLYMADGKTQFKDQNNVPAVVTIKFNVNGAEDQGENTFDPSDFDIEGKATYSSDVKKVLLQFSISNDSSAYNLEGIMMKIPVQNFKQYKIPNSLVGGTVKVENSEYVWRFPQELPRRTTEQITLEYSSDTFPNLPSSGFNFYTLDGKNKICTRQIMIN